MLEPKWCVNNEMKVHNRKLKKHLQVFGNTRVTEGDSNRALFTRHGLHMNSKGKEQIAKKIVKTMKVMLSETKSDPITMKDKEDLGADSEGTEAETTPMENRNKSENLEVCHPPCVYSINKSYYVLFIQSVTTQLYCQ